MSDNIPRNKSKLKEGEVPFYYQILDSLKGDIKSGKLKAGDMILPEVELCRIYGVSRTTVRHAMERLTDENLITRTRGKGSFVADQKLGRSLNHLYSFTEDMKALGLNPCSQILECTKVKADEELKEALNIEINSEVFKLVRLRCASGEPLLMESTYIPYYICPGIEKNDFSSASLYNILRLNYDVDIHRAIETYESVKLVSRVAHHLKSVPGSPAFKIRRISYTDEDMPVELTCSYARSDKCIFKVELMTNKNKIQFKREITP